MATMPVLSLGGEYSFGSAALDSMKSLATDVRGGVVPFSVIGLLRSNLSFLLNSFHHSLVIRSK
jgi:hypothetical protein